MHGAPDLNHRHQPAFESHDPASMGTLRIPCNIIMKTFVAGDGHGADGLILVVGYWILDTKTHRARCMVHSVKADNSDTSEKSAALRYALCAMRFALYPMPYANRFQSSINADCGYRFANSYSPASARHAHDPVDHRIYWLQ